MNKIAFFLISFILISCNQKIEQKKYDNEQKNKIRGLQEFKNYEKKSKYDPCELCLDFLKNYQTNYDKIYETDFINYEGYFSVNFDNLEVFFKKSNLKKYFTNEYINRFNEKIKEIDYNLKSSPQNDGTIDGLEGDIFLCTQDTEENLNQIMLNKVSCYSVSEGKVEIDFRNGHVLLYTIIDGKIDNIVIKK